MPVLETDDGKKLGQTVAIARYLGKKYGYYPEDAYDAWRVDSLIDGFQDVQQVFAKIHFGGGDEEDKKKQFGEFIGNQFSKFLGIVEERLKNNSSQEFLVGDKLTVVDLMMVSVYTGLFTNGDFKALFGPAFEKHATAEAYMKGLTKPFEEYLAKREPRPL